MQQIGNKELLNDHPFKVKNTIINDIWYTLNQASLDLIVQSGGKPFSYYNRFGRIRIDRCKRKIKVKDGKLSNMSIDWAKTKRLRASGELESTKFAYHMFPFTYNFKWSYKKFKHSTVYSYKASRTNGYSSKSGAINKLYFFITENDTNYLKFPIKK